MSSLVIIIDAWSTWPCKYHVKDTMHRIVDFVGTDEVGAVALATYSTNNLNQVEQDEPFYSNSQQIFSNETQVDTLRRQWNDYIPVYTELTDRIISNMTLRENQFGFVALHPLQILYYCNCINPSIENIYFTGFMWDICVKDRNVGYVELNALNNASMFSRKQNIFVKSDLTDAVNGPVVFNNDWVLVSDKKYLYNKN
jgi:hypothetical protein